MSFNISPDVHLKIISQSIVFVGSYNTGERLMKVTLQDSSLFYSQQKIELANGLTGMILFPVNESAVYFYSDSPIINSISTGFTTSTKIPFRAIQDNDVITTYDVKNIAVTGLLKIGDKEFLGSDGLFKSEWLTKINEIKTLQIIQSIQYDLTSNSTGVLGYVKFDGKHKFGFRNNEVDALFEIDINNKDVFTVRKMNYDNITGKLKFSFSVGMIGTEQYIQISVKNTGGVYTNPVVNPRQEIKTLSDVQLTSNGFVMDYQINDIEFDDSIFSVNSDGKDLYINQPLEILTLVNLRQLLEATYYCNNQILIPQLTDLPVISQGNILSFVLNVYRVKGTTDKVIQGTFIINNTISPDNNIVKASLFVDSTKQYKWVFDNTVFASSVITDDNHMFVTKNEKDLWNSKSTWLPPVSNVSNLPTTNILNGYTCFVISEKEIYYYELGSWKTSKQIVSATQNGILSKEQYKELFVESSQFKKIKSTIHINRESLINESDYQKYVGTNIIDLTKRDQLVNTFGSNIINLTLSNKSQSDSNSMGLFGTDSVGLGTNIYGLGTSVIAIGNNVYSNSFINTVSIGSNIKAVNDNFIGLGVYNLGDPNNILEIGNGTSALPANLLSISKTRNILTTGGFAIPNGTNEQFLTADGGYKDVGSIQQIFEKFTGDNIEYYGIESAITNNTGELVEGDYFNDGAIVLSWGKIQEVDVYGKNSISLNKGLAEGDYSAAFGESTKISSFGGLVIGYHNDPIHNYLTTGTTAQPTAPLFIIGNGTPAVKSNAFVVLGNGETQQKGNSKFENGKGLVMKTADGTKEAFITLVDDAGSLRLNIQEI